MGSRIVGRWIGLIIVLGLFPARTPLQQAPSVEPTQDQKPEVCSISGRVVKAGTGEPLKNVLLTIRGADLPDEPSRPGDPQSPLARTDADGQFVLKEIEPGRYYLSAAYPGFVSQQYGQKSPRRPGAVIELGSGKNMKGVVFSLAPASVISGRILDSDGAPMPGARVLVLRTFYVRGQRRMSPVGVASSNDLGEYRVPGLSAGNYYIFVMVTRRLFVNGAQTFSWALPPDSSWAYVSTYYPGTSDPEKAARIEIRAGEEAHSIDVTMLSAPSVRIHGRITNEVSGELTSDVGVRLLRRGAAFYDNAPQLTTIDYDNGAFQIAGVTPGSYNIMAFYPDAGMMRIAQQPLDVGSGDIGGIELEITSGVEISGRLVFDGNTNHPPLGFEVNPVARGDGFFMVESGRMRPDGSFTISGVEPGLYDLKVTGPMPDAYLKSARAGGLDVLVNGLRVTREGAGGTVDLILGAIGGLVQGRVVDNESQPVAGTIVAIVPDVQRRTQSSLFLTTTTDSNGQFVLRAIPPGDYSLFAWEDIEDGAWTNNEYLKSIEGLGKPVHLTEGSSEKIELKPISAALVP
jgi:protocatechuate 3,4-dioxygenase beta subunit